jgi:two-component system response regulator
MNATKTLLVAEDDSNDILLLRHAFERAGFCYNLVHVADGQSAIEFLAGEHSDKVRKGLPLADLLVLDLKMPGVSGFGVLEWLRSQPQLHLLPAVILSSSDLEQDIAKALALGARQYYVKPNNFSGLVELARELSARWFEGRVAEARKKSVVPGAPECAPLPM